MRVHLLQAGGSSQQCQQPAQTPNHPPATSSASPQRAWPQGCVSTNPAPTAWDTARPTNAASLVQSEIWHTHHLPGWGGWPYASPTSQGCSWPPGEASHRAVSGGRGCLPAALGRVDWDQPLLLIKINVAVQISRLSGVSITYHSISCNKLWMREELRCLICWASRAWRPQRRQQKHSGAYLANLGR